MKEIVEMGDEWLSTGRLGERGVFKPLENSEAGCNYDGSKGISKR